MTESKIEIKTPGGVRLNFPNGFSVTRVEEESIDECVRSIENATGREIYGVYLNPDRDEEGVVHDIKFVFRKRI